jgi:manganese oxidase
MLRGGAAISEGNGPSLGRGMGVGSAFDQAMSNGPTSSRQTGDATPAMQGMTIDAGKAQVSQDANSIPGFPQDAYMEGPAMAMDSMFQKPETDGLRPGWSGFAQGMMTLVRILPPDRYNRIMELRSQQGAAPQPMPGMNK